MSETKTITVDLKPFQEKFNSCLNAAVEDACMRHGVDESVATQISATARALFSEKMNKK